MRAVAAVEGGGSDDDGGHGQGQQHLCFCCSCCYHRFLSLGSSPTLLLQTHRIGGRPLLFILGENEFTDFPFSAGQH
jgi:hypothetical protein